MVHIEKIKVKGNIYYKLVHSVRVGGKVKSKSRYLGKELPPPKELKKLKKQFYDEILAARLLQKTTIEQGAVTKTHDIPADAVNPTNVSNTTIPKKTIPKKVGDDLQITPQPDSRSNELYHTLFEKSLDAVFILNPETKNIIDFNSAAQILTGYAANEMFKLPFLELIGKKNIKEVSLVIAKTVFEHKQEVVSFPILNKNQELVATEGIFYLITKQGQNFLIAYLRNISKRKKVQEELKNVEIFRRISDSLSEVVYYADPVSFAPIFTSKGIQRMLGYTPEEWIADPELWQQRIYYEDKEKVMQALLMARKQKTPVDISTRMINGQNDILWVILHVYWQLNQQGNVSALVVVIEDVTGRTERQDKYNILYNNSPVGMLEQDFSSLKLFLKTMKLTTEEEIKKFFEKKPAELKEVMAMVKVLDLNKGVLTLFKCASRESFLKIYLSKNFCRASNEVFFKELVAIAQGKQSFESEIVIFSMDGKSKRITLNWNVPNLYKETYRKVLVTLIDTSLQRELTEIINVKNYAIESSPAGVVITDLEGKITYVNSAFLKLWNIEINTVLFGKKVEEYLPSKDGAMRVLQVLHQKKRWHGNFTIGQVKPRYVESHAAFITDEFKEPLALVFSFIDITELKKTEQIRLEFTNIAAHELKTPIVPLRTLLTMLVEDAQGFGIKEKAMDHLKICLRNVNRLNVLIGDILDISRLEAGGMKFTMDKFNINEVIKNVLSDYVDFIKEKGLLLKSEIPSSIPLLYGDKLRISQVIGNLVKNASNFTDKGSITIKVSLIKGFVQVDVIDTGAGIGKIAQAKLFTKFYQEQDITTRKTKGTGLGLAISKGIIEHHGGKIWAFSEGKRKGSSFSFTIPLKKLVHQEIERKKLEEPSVGDKMMLSDENLSNNKELDSNNKELDSNNKELSIDKNKVNQKFATLKWDATISVGDEILDAQHKSLLQTLNKLSQALNEHKSDDVIETIVSFLDSYIKDHLSYEEKYMVQHKFPEYLAHKKIHQNFITKYQEFRQKLLSAQSNKELLAKEVVSFLGTWWIKHIKIEDHKYFEYVKKHPESEKMMGEINGTKIVKEDQLAGSETVEKKIVKKKVEKKPMVKKIALIEKQIRGNQIKAIQK